jgi:hypothetical protein
MVKRCLFLIWYVNTLIDFFPLENHCFAANNLQSQKNLSIYPPLLSQCSSHCFPSPLSAYFIFFSVSFPLSHSLSLSLSLSVCLSLSPSLLVSTPPYLLPSLSLFVSVPHSSVSVYFCSSISPPSVFQSLSVFLSPSLGIKKIETGFLDNEFILEHCFTTTTSIHNNKKLFALHIAIDSEYYYCYFLTLVKLGVDRILDLTNCILKNVSLSNIFFLISVLYKR